MSRYAVRRVLLLIPTWLAVYTLTFGLMQLTPGGPWDREKPVPREVREALDRKYGLDKPVWQQYVDYLVGVVTRFDFGPSYTSRSRTVNDIIGDFFPVSLSLGLMAMAVGTLLGVSLGVLSALRHNSWIDHLAMVFAIGGVSVPAFVVGPLLVIVFALGLGWVPTQGWGRPEQAILPVLTLALLPAALLARYTRAAMLEVTRMDYIRTARAKGLSERAIVVRHALRNALIPVTTVAGVLLATVITGSFYVELIFNIPGLGRYFVTAVTNRDYPVLMGVTLLFASTIAIVNLLVDLLYGYLDPRIRYD
ncbi:MAG TPA: ABC transporter permease [Chloroflexota bacterium]|nr:ABC transporter permease [Chloroflexota bacterium]